METNRIERHIRALELGSVCAALGARIRTITHVTGMPREEIARLFFTRGALPARGRAPDSPDWYHGANLLERAEACIFVSIYRRIRDLGYAPPEALVTGYTHYRAICREPPRISFDRAFDLASHMDGVWLAKEQSFSLLKCPVCASQYLSAVSTEPASNHECPFCKVVARYTRDPRIQSSFPVRDLPDVNKLQLGIVALSRQRRDQ